MRKEGEILNKYGKSNPFRVPENYFDQFHEQIMAKISDLTPSESPTDTPVPPGIRPKGVETGIDKHRKAIQVFLENIPVMWRVAAVAVAVVSLSCFIYLQGENQRASSLHVAADEGKGEYTDEEIRDIIDETYLDDYELYQLMISEAN
ncbi:MAG: hypothetical protein ACOYJE_03010 [Bacteroidaceae bacterium]|jgi:hypothetical protein